jgi:predicted helicase
MSRLLITQYQTEIEKIIQYSGSRKETAIRFAFQNLLNEYCKPKDFLLIPELDYKTKSGKTIRPDGTVKDAIRLDYGFWESKDQYDNLDEEIDKKFAKGYPNNNILFMVKKEDKDSTPCKIFYSRRSEFDTSADKLRFLTSTKLTQVDFVHTNPDQKSNWINQSDNDFDSLIPLIDKNVKAGKSQEAVFELFSRGVVSNRDEWVYDFSQDKLEDKIKFCIDIYQQTLQDNDYPYKEQIKWDRELTKYLTKKTSKEFSDTQIVKSLYRPYTKQYLYFDKHFNGMTYQWFEIYKRNNFENQYIAFSAFGCNKPFHCLASHSIIDLHLTGDSQCLPLYRYDEKGNRIENITDWGLQQFQNYYDDKTITKLDIFHYTYAVLHNPAYRQKYEQNLKRDFPRIPFYNNFQQWVNWGRQLMDLHINYETVAPYPLKRIDIGFPLTLDKGGIKAKAKLKADKDKGIITLDDVTSLHNIPKLAWEYQLGNRSALEWILDQYKESKPKDKTIAEKFNTYRFADYKEEVIDLIQRVCTISVETMNIIGQM